MPDRISQQRVRNGCLGVLGASLLCVACQSSAPPESREPPAASAPSAASAQPAARASQPLKGSEEEPSAGAPTTEPAAVKLTAAPPQTDKPSGAPAGAIAAADAPKKGDSKAAGDKGAAPAGKETQGKVVSEEAFSTWLQAASPAKAGAPVVLEAVLVAKPPYHCNPEYPHKFKFNAAPAGLAYPEETVRGMKVTPERSVLAMPVKAESAGKPTISGTLSFSVCTEERCMVEKRDLSLALDVM